MSAAKHPQSTEPDAQVPESFCIIYHPASGKYLLMMPAIRAGALPTPPNPAGWFVIRLSIAQTISFYLFLITATAVSPCLP
ncbi:MAG: hypothetical protein EKK37_05095 [Sphingobacteriales bacterium]|nr:MAG: hypothetical protein EKK37_05095 [Sphingobacteriales bacterium]